MEGGEEGRVFSYRSFRIRRGSEGGEERREGLSFLYISTCNLTVYLVLVPSRLVSVSFLRAWFVNI